MDIGLNQDDDPQLDFNFPQLESYLPLSYEGKINT